MNKDIIGYCSAIAQARRMMKQGIINVALAKAKNNELVHVWGDGNALKDYIYIEDFCHVLFDLLEKNVTNEVFNIGSGYAYTINQILNLIKLSFPDFHWVYEDMNVRDTSVVRLNTNKLKQYMNVDFTKLEDILPKLI